MISEHFTGTHVEFILNKEEVLGAVDAEVGALREIVSRSPLVFSLEPRCHGECESQKYAGAPSDFDISMCGAISVP